MSEIIISNEPDVLNQVRDIDYGERQSNYDHLQPFFQAIVDKAVEDLTQGQEFAGYNYEQVMNWNREISKSKVNQNKVVSQIAKYNLADIMRTESWVGENLPSQYLNKGLDSFKKATGKPKEDSYKRDTIQYLCDYLLISPELILNGAGEIYTIESKYFESISDEFIRSVPKKGFSTKKVFQEYARYLGVNEGEVINTEYAIVSKRGSYLWLCTGKKHEHMKDTIDHLIENLQYAQRFGETN